jgi:Tfp pilus assembly PilM family ATPase
MEVSADPLAQVAAAAEVMGDLLRRGGFEGRRVVAAIPRAIPQFRTLRLNVTESAELPRMLAREARNALGVDVTSGKFIVHFLPGDVLRRGSDTHQEGLLVVVRKREVEQFLALLHDCGAEVAALDLEPLSLYRSVQRYSRRRRDSQDVHVMVDLGTRSTQVVIGRAGRIGFHKSISIGTEAMHAAVARKLGLPVSEATALSHRLEQQVREAQRTGTMQALERDPLHRAAFNAARATIEDLSRELSLCLRYYCITFRCKRPDRVLLCGTAAEDPRLCTALASALPIPVQPRRPLTDLEIPSELAPVMSQHTEEWATALGVALRFTPPGIAGRAGISRDVQAVADHEMSDETDLAHVSRRALSPPAIGARASKLIAGTAPGSARPGQPAAGKEAASV